MMWAILVLSGAATMTGYWMVRRRLWDREDAIDMADLYYAMAEDGDPFPGSVVDGGLALHPVPVR